MNKHYAIEDVDEPEITAEQVRQRIDDWLRRLDELFGTIRAWAAGNGWTARDDVPVPMREEPMEKFGISERMQPSLILEETQGAEIRIVPKGLWVIGANGRVDLYSPKGVFTLVDVADPLQRPEWVLHRVGKRNGKPFDPRQLADMV